MPLAPQFTGRQLDSETGLYYYRSRYYAPQAGRFTTADPIGLLGGPNLYVYVNNNPVNWIDPWGLKEKPKGDSGLNWAEKLYARKKIKEFLTQHVQGKDIPLIPGTIQQQTIDMVSSEIADLLRRSDIQTLKEGTPEQQQKLLNRITDEMKSKHPDWPVEQWGGLIGNITGGSAGETGMGAPEPPSWVLICCGLLFLFIISRKRVFGFCLPSINLRLRKGL